MITYFWIENIFVIPAPHKNFIKNNAENEFDIVWQLYVPSLWTFYRPTDLTTIKKNVESGIIRTTQEFQRDMMLMFTNAIMYNNCNHNVHKMAVEMYDDVMTHIEVRSGHMIILIYSSF